MCGIFGYVGKKEAKPLLIEGLENLEYRGYDSAGIAISTNKGIKIVKRAGKVEELKKALKEENIDGSVGIAHTRWATHGLPSELNAHPHTDVLKSVTLVHNGIIENYLELKNEFNLKTQTESDTEIIAGLIAIMPEKNNLEKLKSVTKLLKGSYALAIIFSNEPECIYLAKKESPLMVGKSEDDIFISSDANAFKKYCSDFYILKNNEFAKIKYNNIEFFNKNKKINKKTNKFLNTFAFENKNKYLMQDEIAQTPDALKETAIFFENFKDIKNYFKNIDKIYLVACGTAYHSCLFGKKYLEFLNVPIFTEIASEFKYSKHLLTKNTLCIFVSQSGETADTIACVKKCKCKTLAITNVPNSSITFACKKTILMKAGWERAVASTKAYSCQLLIFYLLKCLLKDEKPKIKTLIRQSKQYLNSLNLTQLAKKVANFDKVMFIGRQDDYITAKEGALKLKEISYINCTACPSGELKHGTLALVDENTLIILISTKNNLISKNLLTKEEIEARGGKCLILGNFENADIKLPKLSSDLMPILSILPLQVLACEVCILKGYNPDKPRNLSKSVTVE